MLYVMSRVHFANFFAQALIVIMTRLRRYGVGNKRLDCLTNWFTAIETRFVCIYIFQWYELVRNGSSRLFPRFVYDFSRPFLSSLARVPFSVRHSVQVKPTMLYKYVIVTRLCAGLGSKQRNCF